MYSTVTKLKYNTKELLDSVKRGEEVIITYRGKPAAKLVPFSEQENSQKEPNELFGLWADRDDIADVNEYIRQIRKNRLS